MRELDLNNMCNGCEMLKSKALLLMNETPKKMSGNNNLFSKQFGKALALIVFGCMSNNFFLELLVRKDPGAGPLLTLLQFSFISIEGFLQHFDLKTFRFRKLTQPFWFYMLMTIIFFGVSFINNKAFDFNISQPLHMLFKSSSLISTFLMGLLLGRKYNFFQGLGISVVTVGIVLTTLADAGLMKTTECCAPVLKSLNDTVNSTQGAVNETLKEVGKAASGDETFFWWSIGITLLIVALILSTLLGHLQEIGYRKWGKCQREAMFYQHTLSMLWFMVFMGDLKKHISIWTGSEPLPFFSSLGLGFVSDMWVYAILNIVTQYICIRGVYISFETVGSLTSNFILTCRKFLSILLSIWIFNNPWTSFHWFGTSLVFVGTCLYVYPEFASTFSKKKAD
eukprot:TRINITY_DN16986_c0_g1_i1.p1 TRINITY_DN16986_c0_g1~~TRINITY_DN16986_c0_g1_i1.p1  ORF type:complete len:395 (+),score=88.77 TRINITY_DN16986_c0_g1_i1:822-2006(+)